MSFIASVPNGSTIVFKAGGTYRVNVALKISGKTNVTFNGNGATIKAVGTGYNENYSLFYFVSYGGGNSGIKVRNFNLVGSDPTPGTFSSGQEGQHGILVDGGTNFEIDHNTFSAAFGDGVEVNSGASGVHIHDNTFTNTGRNGLSVIWGNHVEFDHNTLGHMGYMPFDVEPNTSSQPSSFISIHDNATGYWSNAFFAVDGSSTGAAIHDISVTNNTSTGMSLLTVVVGPGPQAEHHVHGQPLDGHLRWTRPALHQCRRPDGHGQHPVRHLRPPRLDDELHRGHLPVNAPPTHHHPARRGTLPRRVSLSGMRGTVPATLPLHRGTPIDSSIDSRTVQSPRSRDDASLAAVSWR